ncbi:MAG: hypothetical protein JJE52_04220 [Acidimicrobiia bacterium]|nr:hypothetical protein [Acidimicrobiia bacterium]
MDDPNDTPQQRPRDDWEIADVATSEAPDLIAPGPPSSATPGGDGPTADDGDADEDAVRRYLTWIDDPSSLRDEDHITELQSRIDAARDPIDKIHLASELHWAKKVDGTHLRRDFLAVARRWAEANRIVPEAFMEMGVPTEDLRQAGFAVDTRPRRKSETGTVAPSTPRAERVGVERIREGAMSFDAAFTIADLRDRVGGSPGTVRKALEAMVAEGRVENLGPDANWPGPGRPPNRYVRRRS